MISSHFSGEKTEAQVVRVPLELAGILLAGPRSRGPGQQRGNLGGWPGWVSLAPSPHSEQEKFKAHTLSTTQQLIRKTLVAFINASPWA